ncbi:autotransporter domain-containing protein, partial [Xanthobacter agilis]
NTYSGGTVLLDGTLQVSSDANLGDASGALFFMGGTLSTIASFTSARNSTVNGSSNAIDTATGTTLTLSGAIAGEGSLTKQGAGTLTLSGTNTYSGGTVLEAGTLSVSSDASLGARAGALSFQGGTLATTATFESGRGVSLASAGGTLNTASATTLTLSGVISGAGGLTKTGAGTLALSGDSSGFTGATSVNAGTLEISGGLGGGVSVASGATLQGAGGTLTGAVTVASGGVLSGSQGTGTLTLGSLSLSSGAVTNVTLSAASTSAVFTTTGALTVAGTLNVTGTATYGVGVYRVFASGGTLTDNGLALGTTPTGSYTTALDVGTSTVDVVVSGHDTSLQYWSANGSSRGGSGTWTSSNLWLDTDGSTAAWGRGTGVFSGAAGTVSVVGAQSFATLEFLTTGYEVEAGTGGSLDLGTGGQVWAEGADVTATISAPITGTGALTKVGEGTIVLSGTNTYSGGTVLEAGTLQVSSDANLGASAGALSFQGGTLATTATFESGRGVSLASAGGTLNTASATTLTLSGVISGEGGLTKTGAGTLILTGANTYTGVTTINAGTLQIGNGGTSGSIVGDVVNNAALVFNRSDTFTFPGTITGAGTVSFLGGGTVEFSDPGAYTGPISVGDATVHLENGSKSASTFTVDDGGTLSGNGTIGGLIVNNSGVAAPGNSPGTIVVNGTVTFNAGSVYRVDVTPAGAHDLITATGAVSLSSGASVAVIAEAGAYAANTTYAIITTTNAVSGTFGSVTSNYAFLTPSLSYDAQNVYLTLLYNNVDFATYARTSNERGVAVAAQALGSGNAVYDAILDQSNSSVAGAFNALSGEIYASADTVIQQQSVYVREAVGARLRQSVVAPSTAPLAYTTKAPATAQLGPDLTPTLWAQGYGGWGNAFGDGNAASVSSTIGGFLIGADVAVADNARAGVFGGFSQSSFDVDARASSGSMDNYDAGLYAAAQFGAIAARGGFAYAWHDVSGNRTIAFPGIMQATSGDYSAGSVQLFGELGYDTRLGAFDLEPFVGLAYLNIAGANFSETGGSAGLSVDVGSMATTYTTLGVRAATSVDLFGHALTPSVSLGWQHAFGDTTPNATMRFNAGTLPFQVSGVPIAEDAFAVAAGLGYALSNEAAFSVNYSGQIANTAAQNAFTAQFSMKF